jgi:superfamily II DNA/RNA helicase
MIIQKRVLSGFLAAMAVGLAVACGGTTIGRTIDPATTDPAKLGILAATIETVSPAEAERFLKEAGHDEASFRKAVEEIMGDSNRVVIFSATYTAAKN